MIYTSYFAKLKQIVKNENLIPISIACWPPHWYIGKTYTKLAPTVEILEDYKRTGNLPMYIDRYKNEVLFHLDPFQVYRDLEQIAGEGNAPVLLCFEKPDNFCHRQLVTEWLSDVGKICELEI